MADLSIIIPARNEEFLRRTLEDIQSNLRGDTEVIAVLDGYWPDPFIPDHPRVTLIHHALSIGQRAATNEAARLSRARFIMKCDAHCSFDEGFDVKLLAAAEELGPTTVQIPAQKNLHAFDWVCDDCGVRTYQGPTPQVCKCGSTVLHREMVWQPRRGTTTTAWRFDRDLHFQYWHEFSRRPEGRIEFPETLSCLGACWFMGRERFWELEGLDEDHGSWGQMGTEISCKSWLSGGRMVVNKSTWFAHMFRTQGGDFGFPYQITHSEQERARAYSRDLWLDNKWPGAKRTLPWLIEHFAPVPGWENGAP